MERVKVVVMPGNNYTKDQIKPFLKLIRSQPWCESLIWIDLLENRFTHLSYDQLDPRNYNHYIERFLNVGERYLFYGVSMGCYHIQNFVSKKPQYARAVVWLEPTMCGGDYDKLFYFEDGRGSGDILKFFREHDDIDSLSSQDKVIDIAVSRNFTNPMPSIVPLSVIYTKYGADGNLYTPEQIMAKDKFLAKLRGQVIDIRFYLLDTEHTADVTASPEVKQEIVDIMGNTLIGM